MYAKYVNDKGEVMTIDNGKKIIGEVKIEGDNLNDVRAIDILVNKMTSARGIPLEYVKANPIKFQKVDGIYKLNTASDFYFKNTLPTLMKNHGYRISAN